MPSAHEDRSIRFDDPFVRVPGTRMPRVDGVHAIDREGHRDPATSRIVNPQLIFGILEGFDVATTTREILRG